MRWVRALALAAAFSTGAPSLAVAGARTTPTIVPATMVRDVT
jgi:hypothetical protein